MKNKTNQSVTAEIKAFRKEVLNETQELRKDTDGLKKQSKQMRQDIDGLSSSQMRIEHTIAEKLATKEDIGRLANAILKNEIEIQKVKETMATKNDIQKVLNQIDHLGQKFTVENRKMWVHDQRFVELEPRVDDHEKRLARLEGAK